MEKLIPTSIIIVMTILIIIKVVYLLICVFYLIIQWSLSCPVKGLFSIEHLMIETNPEKTNSSNQNFFSLFWLPDGRKRRATKSSISSQSTTIPVFWSQYKSWCHLFLVSLPKMWPLKFEGCGSSCPGSAQSLPSLSVRMWPDAD